MPQSLSPNKQEHAIMGKAEVDSGEGWLALPKISVPTMKTTNETRLVIKVVKISFRL